MKFGLMLRGSSVPAWQAACINDLLAVEGIELSLLIVPAGRRSPSQAKARLAELFEGPSWLWRLYNKGWVERRSRASRAVDLSSLLADVDVLSVTTESPKPGIDVFAPEDVAAIVERQLDFIIRFAFGILRGPVLTSARLGVWSFHHGDERDYRGRPPGFWELREGRPTVGAIVQVLTERLDGGKVMERGTFRVVPHSYLKTRDGLFLGATELVTRACRRVLAGGDTIPTTASSTTAAVRHDPTNATTVAFLLQQARAAVAHFAGVLFRTPKWTIGVVDAPIEGFLNGIPWKVRWLPEPAADRYLADPFALDERTALAEEFDYRSRLGRIVNVDLETGRTNPASIEISTHASYPFTFSYEGDLYCVPEIAAAGEARLFRRGENRWADTGATLPGVAALDSTIFQWEGHWWLLCTDLQRGSNERLLAFYADAPTGPWTPHQLNPVKHDVTSSRPGGTPFVHEGALYRPAQNDSLSYGGSLTICRVDSLTPNSYAETVVAFLVPNPAWRHRAGLHTIAAYGDRTLIDARRDAFLWREVAYQLAARVKRR